MMKRIWLLSCMLVAVLCVKAQTGKFDYIFQEAVKQKLAKHYAEAIDLFDYCHRLDPKSGATMFELADLYRQLKNDSLSIAMLEEASRLYPDNYWYKLYLVASYEGQRRNDEALNVLEDMSQRFPDKTEVLMMLLDAYRKNGDKEKLLKVMDKVEQKEGKNERISEEKFDLLIGLGEEKRAFDEMYALVKEYPNELRYQVIIGNQYFRLGKYEEAYKQYKMVEAKDSNEVTMLLSMCDYYEKENNEPLFCKYVSKVLCCPNADEALKLVYAKWIVYEDFNNQKRDSAAVLGVFDDAMRLPDVDSDIIELRVVYMVNNNMPREEIKPFLYKILEITPQSVLARQQLLSYAIEEEDTMGIVNACKPAVDHGTSDPVCYYYLGVAYLQLDKKQEAVDAFRGGLRHVEEESEYSNRVQLYVNMYSLLGDLYHQLGQDDMAFLMYDSCLVYRQNEPTVLNNYAYYLSLKKKDLDRAEKMSRMANELDPDNPTYLDTYAWVLYQMKRYEEAKQYMDRVVELMDKKELEESEDVLQHIEMINKKVDKK